jgi:hypothetical protein
MNHLPPKKPVQSAIAGIREALTQTEHDAAELKRALRILEANGYGLRNGRGRGGRRHLSVAARHRIATAQKKRWAAWRKKAA